MGGESDKMRVRGSGIGKGRGLSRERLRQD